MLKRIDFIYFDAGGGHRAAALALQEVIQRQHLPFNPNLVNLQELLDQIDVFRKLTGLRLQELYNSMLKKGWTLGSAQLVPGMQAVIRMFHHQQVELLKQRWLASKPDLVVSLIPHFNRAIYDSLSQALPHVPMVTILTDIADYPPHFWMEKQDQYFICGSEKAEEQAFALGHHQSHVIRVSGMILSPRFYDIAPLTPEQRAAERAKLGFDAKSPVGLVLFGGHGSSVMFEIAKNLPDRQLLMICGHNRNLAARLREHSHPAPMFVEGFTKEIPHYMQLADYFIGKPGPGSISEAVAMHLPVIVERNAWTLPQERYNADWIREQGIGIVLPNFRNIAEAVDELLAPEHYAAYRGATERMENRAVFEIPAILDQLLRSGGMRVA